MFDFRQDWPILLLFPVCAITAFVGLILEDFLLARGYSEEQCERVQLWLGLSAWPIFLLVVAAIYNRGHFFVAPILRSVFEWTIQRVGLVAAQIIIAAIVTALGIGAYFFKRKRQDWYGAVEILVGLLSAVFVVGSLSPNKLDLAKWATLAGSAYVIARGLENRSKGKEFAGQ